MKVALTIVLLMLAGTSNAAWLTAAGRVLSVSVYPHTDTVLVKLESAGVAAGCADASLFAIDGSTSADRGDGAGPPIRRYLLMLNVMDS